MRKLLVATALILGMVSTAGAQSVTVCKRIAEATARLACFDALPDSDQALTPQLQPSLGGLSSPADPSLAAAESAVRKNLPQPDSARFIGLQRRPDAVCGFVNARGESGGYTGSKLFVYVASTGQTHVLDRPQDDPAGAAARATYETHCR